MQRRPLRIAWVGAGPAARESGGVPGVATDLLYGLSELGHRIDCFFPGTGHRLPERLDQQPNLKVVWGTSSWRWDRWYSRTRATAFASGLLARGFAALRLRREIADRHRREPYDLIYQFSNIEALSVPRRIARRVPLVIHPETHVAGELRGLLSERRIALRCQPRRSYAIAVAMMALRSLIQRARIRRAELLICISSVFRDHLVRDYRFPAAATVVIPNPVRLERFADPDLGRALQQPPAVLVLGRVAVRKGVEDVVAVAQALAQREPQVHVRVVGGPGLWSDYTSLLADLPERSAEYVGRINSSLIPEELARTDVLLQASRYEPFALTVAEALASGVPVVASTEVGAIEGVAAGAVTALAPGDVDGYVTALLQAVERLREDPRPLRTLARTEAERLFSGEVVCAQVSEALYGLLERRGTGMASGS